VSQFSFRRNLSRASFAKAGNCRNFLTSSRDRREALADRLDMRWRELRRHVTIERDPEKIFELSAEIGRRKRQREAVDKLSDCV